MNSCFVKISLISISSFILNSTSVSAQLIPDRTLGIENSTVIPVNSTRDNIEGGATRGSNLFHSFEELNVNLGRQVYFNNSPGIENIITRITGSNSSKIFGTLGVNGNANLYLINPNGLIFGDGARLDINGTFTGTTADALKLGKNAVYSAVDTANSSLLTIMPGALFFNQIRSNQKIILNQGNLNINNGGNISLSGDIIQNNGTIEALNGNVSLETINGNLDTGNINVSSPIVNGQAIGNAGNIFIKSNKNIILNNKTTISANGVLGGSLNIKANEGLIANNSSITSISTGNIQQKKGGNININVKFIDFNNSFLSSLTEGSADTGNITITAQTISLDGVNTQEEIASGFLNRTKGTGNGGEVTINTKLLELNNGARINASTAGGGGNAGNLVISAETISLSGFGTRSNGRTFVSGLFARSELDSCCQGVGDAGGLRISTTSLNLSNGATISTSTFRDGNGGELIILAERISLNGDVSNNRIFSSGFFSSSFGRGEGGQISINTNRLSVINGSSISVGAFGQGNGGSLNIVANEIEVIGRNLLNGSGSSTLSSNAYDLFGDGRNTGNAGNINIVTNKLRILETARIAATNFQDPDSSPPGLGRAGNINIKAEDVLLDLGSILANGNVKGGGDITIDSSKFIILRNRSKITTNVGETIGFSGGNITINSPLILALPKENKISATAVTSAGGNININANAIFGYPQNLTIDASSALGVDGTIDINEQFNINSEFFRTEADKPSEETAEVRECPIDSERTANFGRRERLGGRLKVRVFSLKELNEEKADRRQSLEKREAENPDLPIDLDKVKTDKPLEQAVGWYRSKNGSVVLTKKQDEVKPLNRPVNYSSNCK